MASKKASNLGGRIPRLHDFEPGSLLWASCGLLRPKRASRRYFNGFWVDVGPILVEFWVDFD
eukprot:7332038-Karenia_brevis.AAC.1